MNIQMNESHGIGIHDKSSRSQNHENELLPLSITIYKCLVMELQHHKHKIKSIFSLERVL
jgi:hypothetical protein